MAFEKGKLFLLHMNSRRHFSGFPKVVFFLAILGAPVRGKRKCQDGQQSIHPIKETIFAGAVILVKGFT